MATEEAVAAARAQARAEAEAAAKAAEAATADAVAAAQAEAETETRRLREQTEAALQCADVADARADAAELALAAAQAEAKRLEACLKAARAQVETARVQAETARVQVETAQAAPIETPGLSLRSRGKRILVLEGGGQKAYAMYALLRKLESLLGLSTPIAQFYDLVCGTSAGGASACVHAIELPPPLLCPIPCLLLCSLSGCSPIECQTTGSRSHRPRHGRRAWR